MWTDAIAWINENNGFLMVIITFVYVIATVFICIFNAKSARASRDQITASQKQQVQNAGLQLYSLRRDVVNKIGNHQFNDVFWDVPLLFDEKISEDFSVVEAEARQLEALQMKEHLFDNELSMLFSKQHKDHFDTQLVIAKAQKNYQPVKDLLYRFFADHEKKPAIEKEIDEFIETLQQEDIANDFINTKAFELIQNMKTYIQDSVKVPA